ncbi:MAG: acyltransferase [Oscillospiraceae bacterium]|nr:acyltransferase [Oscillospiraceae bacterium]
MRKHYIDNIRSLCIILVLIYHVFMMYTDIISLGTGSFYPEQPWDAVMYLIYPWFMLLLFLIAGMCSRYYLDSHTAEEFRKSRTTKLLVPSTIGLFVFGWVQGYISMSIAGAFEADGGMQAVPLPIKYLIMALSGTGPLWFIQELWVLSMILLLIRKFEKGRLYELCSKANIIVLLLLAVPVWLSGYVLNMPVITVYRFGIYTLVFFLGYFVFANDSVISTLEKYCIPLIIGAAVLGGAYIALYFGENFAEMPVLNSPLAVAFAWVTCLAVLGGMKKWGDRSTTVSAFIAKKNWGLYLFHYFPISISAYLLRTYTAIPALPCYLISLVAGFCGALLLYEAFSRIPFIRWAVLGIKKVKTPQNIKGETANAR